MRFASSALHMKGLCWKGSLGCFNQFHSLLQLERGVGEREIQSLPTNPSSIFSNGGWCSGKHPADVSWKGGRGERRLNHMCTTSGCHLRCRLFPQGSNCAKLGSTLPPSRFSTYGTATAWGGGSCLAPRRALDRREAPWALRGFSFCWRGYR